MPPAAIPLVLLKTQSKPHDPYEAFFAAHPFQPGPGADAVPFTTIHVPVLHHRYTNSAALEALIVAGKLGQEGSHYGALIVTSQRAVESLGSVLERLQANPTTTTTTLLANTRVYVVGPATAKAMSHLGFPPPHIHGASCGTGDALAEFILSDYPTPSQPLLFLVGETRRDIIPRVLGAAGIPVEEMVVYETAVAESFRERFSEAVEQTQRERWVVVFSPAGADVAVGVLKEHREGGWEEGGSWVAAIGPTTERCLRDVLESPPEVVAGRPSPEGLWEAITEFMKQR